MTISAAEANAIAKALTRDGQSTLAAKWKNQADELAKLESNRRKYLEAAGIVANLYGHVDQACKERGYTLATIAAELGLSPTGLYPLKNGKTLSPQNMMKVLRWLGGAQ